MRYDGHTRYIHEPGSEAMPDALCEEILNETEQVVSALGIWGRT
jgi:hypothetical protein